MMGCGQGTKKYDTISTTDEIPEIPLTVNPKTPEARNVIGFERARHSGAPAPIPARVRSLRSETAWFTRYRPSLAIRRPSATIRQDRSLSQAPVATPAALPRYHRRRLLPPLTDVACTPLPRLRAERNRSPHSYFARAFNRAPATLMSISAAAMVARAFANRIAAQFLNGQADVSSKNGAGKENAPPGAGRFSDDPSHEVPECRPVGNSDSPDSGPTAQNDTPSNNDSRHPPETGNRSRDRFLTYVEVLAADGDKKTDEQRRREEKASAVGKRGVEIAIMEERKRHPDRELESMPHFNPGYDIISRKGNATWYIEVKAVSGVWLRPVTLTKTEWLYASEYGDDYSVHVVEGADGDAPVVHVIQGPATVARFFGLDHGWSSVAASQAKALTLNNRDIHPGCPDSKS